MVISSEELSCCVCDSNSVEIVNDFAKLPRATSDCRPFPAGGCIGICSDCHAIQKPADATWQRDAAAIYGRYDIFRQAADHAEQRVFDQQSGISLKRSELVLMRLSSAVPLPSRGRALDVGCGNGPTLRALAAIAPDWQLYGHDISSTNATMLNAIPKFQQLYTGDLVDIPSQFDLILLSHSLEHIPEPVKTLAILKSKLAPSGKLLVEVPNIRQNIFDLVVADHRTHFDVITLSAVARRAGFAHVHVFDNWAFKELTLIASDYQLPMGSSVSVSTPLSLNDLWQRVEWLTALLAGTAKIAATATSFGLFGTAIAATWLFGPLRERVGFFVDEDPSRIGQMHEGRPILSPDQTPAKSTVFVPLVPAVADAVAKRLTKLGIDARQPPEQVFDSL